MTIAALCAIGLAGLVAGMVLLFVLYGVAIIRELEALDGDESDEE